MQLLSAYELPAGVPWRMCSWSAKFDGRAGRWTEIHLVRLLDVNGSAHLAGSKQKRRDFGEKPSCPAGPVLSNEKTSALVNDMTTSAFSVVVSWRITFPHLAYRSGSLVTRANNTAARWAGPAAVEGRGSAERRLMWASAGGAPRQGMWL